MIEYCKGELLSCLLFQHMNEGLAYCRMEDDGDFTYLMVNLRFEEQTGLKGVVGRRVTEVIPNIMETDPELLRIYADVAETGKPRKFEYYVKGLDEWFALSAFSPREGFFVVVFDVITERKKRHQLILEALAALHRIVAE